MKMQSIVRANLPGTNFNLLKIFKMARMTRNGGVNPMDLRPFYKIVQDLNLTPTHTVKDEVVAQREFQQKASILPSVTVSQNCIITESAAYLTSWIIYKDAKSKKKDKSEWMDGLSITPIASTKIIRNHFSSNTLPVTFFLGEPLRIGSVEYEHCWAGVVWKDEEGYQMLIKDCITHREGAKVPLHARTMASDLKIQFVKLIPALPIENTVEDDCVLCALKSISNFLDGFMTVNVADDVRIYDVTRQKYV
jgi:hypothetical protein